MIPTPTRHHRPTAKSKMPRFGKSSLDRLDRHQRGCEAWQQVRTLRGRLGAVVQVNCHHEGRQRYAVDVVSEAGRCRRVLFDLDGIAMLCQRWRNERVTVRAYREDGKWDLDECMALTVDGHSPIARVTAARTRLQVRRTTRTT